MSHCSSCGVEIPDGQRVCSMCYGDPFYGRDGIYLAWLEQQQAEAAQKAQYGADMQREYEQAMREQQEQP